MTTQSRLHSAHLTAGHFIAVALIFLCTCSRPPSPQAEPPLEGSVPVRLWRYFKEGIGQFGDSRAGIIVKLGPPEHIYAEGDLVRTNELSQEDQRLIAGHGAINKNEISKLVYEGLVLMILKVNSPPYREFVYDVTVTSRKYRMPGNLNVGSKRQEVLQVLGNPARSNDRGDFYYAIPIDDSGRPVGYESSIIFSYRGDSVTKIHFWLNID